MKILVADDDSISRRLMQHTLRNFGYEVILAENGRRAAEFLSHAEGPRLALVDWMMPNSTARDSAVKSVVACIAMEPTFIFCC